MGEKEREKLLSIEIDNFSEYIEVSKKRRSKPYIQGKCRVPKKYLGSDYHWVKKGKFFVLARVQDGLILTSNSLSAGKPKYKKINGQEIYNGNISRQARASLVKKIHEYFIPILKDIPVFDDISQYPLTLELLFYIRDQGNNNIDNDNKWIWRKCIQDTISELKKWPDDNNYVISRNEEETILIPEDQEQKLIINIYGKSNRIN